MASPRFLIRSFRVFLSVLAPLIGLSAAEAQFSLTRVARGLSEPVQVVNSGDSRLFIVEKTGKIKVLHRGKILPNSFLDISHRVSSGSEQGLLSLAFHPQFSKNRRLFINYTDRRGDTVIASYLVSRKDRNKVDISSRRVVLRVSQPYANHNGGCFVFGSDGYLYIGMGDGGSGGDPENRAQDLTTLLGKILRINVGPGRGYKIPSSNPFWNTTGARKEIFAYGMRNPWRCSFDEGRLFVGDVGQGQREEVDIIESGNNYGWRVMEGEACYSPSPNCESTGLTLPIHDYSHDEGQSITGGFVYRGSQIASLKGKYVFGDFSSGKIWSLSNNGSSWSREEVLSSRLLISSFGTDYKKELYVVDFSGGLYRLVDSD
jgi:glucose/arabinose dehydrogenase